MEKPRKLTPDEIAANLATLPEWECEEGELRRTLRFASYLDGVNWATQAAREAEAMNHHPELRIGWRTVQVRISTHSVSGISNLDFEFIRRLPPHSAPE